MPSYTYTYTTGAVVTYLGGIAALAGEYRVTGPCTCGDCQRAPEHHRGHVNAERVTDGRRLQHCAPDMLRLISGDIVQLPSGTDAGQGVARESRGLIEITHNYEQGTLLDGTTPADGRKGTDSRAVLDTYSWRYSRGLGWYQRGSRDKPARRERIERTAEALRDLGYEVTVSVDDTPRDMAEAEADRAQRMEDRADAIERKAQRRAQESKAREAKASQTLDAIPLGQPLLIGHHSYAADKRRREKAWANMDKAVQLDREARYHAERAQIARRHMDHRYNWLAVAEHVKRLEADMRRFKRQKSTSPYVEDTRNKLAYWREIRAEQIASGEAPNFTREDVAVGGWVKGWVGDRYYRIVRVNKATVTIATTRSAINPDDWLTNRLEYHRISGYLTPEEADALLTEEKSSAKAE
ncbi:DUF3560 domain-containing protein [Saccharomonospora azurea]|uniref:DUF3560 domain-containing protein n=1 Tax=Saccharomonospora azurea TaxID=40988 RepID=UPI00332C6D09